MRAHVYQARDGVVIMAKSARKGVTPKQRIVKVSESEINEAPRCKPHRIRGPLIHCKSKKPIHLTNAEIEGLLT
jgi:hypothetical protein